MRLWRGSREHPRAAPASGRSASHPAIELVSLGERICRGEGADLLPRLAVCRARGRADRTRRVPAARCPRRKHHSGAQRAESAARLLQCLPAPRDAPVPGAGCGGPRRCAAAGGHRRRAYHLWTYDLDGRLIAAPYLSGQPQFDKALFSLYPAGVESWGGFVFLNLTPSRAAPLQQQIAGIPERLARYPLNELRIGHTIRYEVAANWKVLCENYNECYHCAGVHPELCALVPAFRERGGANLDWLRGIPHRPGAYTFTKSGTTSRRAFPTLNEDERVRHKGELLYPNLFVSLACDHVAVFILQPRSATHTAITCHFLFEPFELEKPDFDHSDTTEFWDLVNAQDWAICEAVQQGISARVHQRGYYAPMEDFSLDIRRYVLDRIGDAVDVT